MKPLIDNGHVFIAQPPLYKLKKGKSQKYISDDSELNKFINNDIAKSYKLTIAKKEQSEADFIKLLDSYSSMQTVVDQFSSKRDKLILHNLAFFEKLNIDLLKDKKNLSIWCEKFTKHINDNTPINIIFNFEPSSKPADDALHSVTIKKITNGVTSHLEPLNKHFFISDNYLDLISLGFSNYSDNNFKYSNIESSTYSDNFTLSKCFDALISLSRSTISLQRYKGLGEMNPNQLEETTMNTKSRTLLKVMPLEDGNQVVVELMGDDVEMRKQFIKQRYSSVKNLDI